METAGTMLKREREAQGLSLKEIASITRIPISALQNIENDRFDLLPAEVFARGFVRNYARELQISTDDVMLAYNAHKHQGRVELIEPRIREAAVHRSNDTVPPLVLAAKDVERGEATSGGMDAGPRTFRFAYLIVFLVVASSLGLSILFTGTGEAEENDKRRVRPVVESDADAASPWLMNDEKLTTKPTPAAAETDDWSLSAAPAAAAADESWAAPSATPTPTPAPAADDAWTRPAFPREDLGK